MLKKIIFFLLILPSIACANFSNVIIFGDSLSDIGNFPESPAIYWDQSKPKTLLNAVAQFYVPFANPVDTATSNTAGIPWPTLEDRYLSPQPPIDGQPRQYRSMGWTQLFLSLAYHERKTPQKTIVPSYLLKTQHIPLGFSINYAWGYATSDDACVNPYYEKTACTEDSIQTSRAQYVENPVSKTYEQIQVPGLSKQITLFLEDFQNKKVSIDQDTVYAMWIGGNDLIVAAKALTQSFNPFPSVALMMGRTSWHVVSNIRFLLKALPENKRPKFIYIFNIFNPKLTPAFYGKGIANFGNFVVHCSNFFLKLDADIFNHFSDTKIVVLDAHSWYEKAAETPVFKATLGKGCQLSVNYESPRKIPSDNCVNYLFWNDVHPAIPMQSLTAKYLFEKV